MARLRPRTASVGDRSDLVQHSPPLGIIPLRPSPAAAAIVQNLAASLIGNIQEDIRCACHIEKALYSGDNQGTILSWNTSDASRATFYDGLGAPVNVVVGVNENKDIWAGLANGNIMILNLETKSLKGQIIHAHDAAVNCITVGIQCAWSGGDDFLIKKWDMEGVELFSYNHHHGFIKDLLVLRNDPADRHIRLWGASSDTSISVAAMQDSEAQHILSSDIKILNAHSKGVSALCLVMPDAIWSGYEDGSIVVWSALGVLRKQVQQAHRGPVGSFVVMGAHVWSGSGDHTVLVWESSSLQLLFSLGDHGGFVKSMVRVEYMCWVFASGKNVKVWCAQSVWDLYEGEKDRLTRSVQKLNESLERTLRDKQSLENAGKKTQQDLQATQQQLNEQRSSGASALEKSSAEIDKLKTELAKTMEDLETARESAEKYSGSLDEEIQILLGKLSKLKAEKDAGDKAAIAKMQGLEKDLKKTRQEQKITLEDLAALKIELETTQRGLENSDSKGEDLLAQRELDKQKAVELEKSLKAANDRSELFQKDLTRAVKEKEDAVKTETSAQMEFEAKRAELEGRIKQLQVDLDKAHQNANANLTAKDVEMQKVQIELKKKSKELKKALKDAGEEKKQSAKELEGLKEVIDQLKKTKEISSSTDAESSEKLASLASELQNSRDDLQNVLKEKEERDTALEKTREDFTKSINDLEQALKERDEARNDSVALQENVQSLQLNLKVLKDAASVSDASGQALTKERDELSKALSDAEAEIQKLKVELSQLSDSAASQACVLQELTDAGEKELRDLQLAEQSRADIEKSREDEQKKHSEELAQLVDSLGSLRKENVQLEERLAQASTEWERNRAKQISEEDSTGQLSRKLDQLKEDKTALEGKLVVKAAELQQISLNLEQIKKDKSAIEQELDDIKQRKAVVEEKFSQKNAELEHALQQISSDQDTHTKIFNDLQDLRAQNDLLEGKLSSSLREVEELRKTRRLQEELAAQQAAEFDQPPKVNAALYECLLVSAHMNAFSWLLLLLTLGFRAHAKESATLVAANAARRVEELQDEIARLEMKLENALMKAKSVMGVDDPVWARIRELENSLMQSHMNYRLLNQEVRRMRKKRERPRDNRRRTTGVGHACQAGGPNVSLQVTQPGLTIDYSTKLKVSSGGEDEKIVKNIQVCGQNSDQDATRRIIPIQTRIPQPEFPQRMVVPVRTPSPSPETIEPVMRPRSKTTEKERYFPSHGPLRVRRGLSPGRDQF
ncbi:hypothetical protein R1flu_010654 [Riccia fluitans]|uniref:Uncharacterized protein n=1 Tax=Riccia fluitans TaxID=41844 RepID=A0ABD1Z9R3_9MARC